MKFEISHYLSKKIRIISFFAIVMVVFLHTNNDLINIGDKSIRIEQGFSVLFQDFLSNGIARTAVPLFFLISGMLFFKDFDTNSNTFQKFYAKIKRRIKTLFIPYIFWSFLGVIIYFCLQSIPISKLFFTKDLITDYSLERLFTRIFVEPIPYQLWFIRDLLFLVFVSPILYFAFKDTKILFLSISLMLMLWVLEYDLVFISNESLFFFSIGSIFGMKNLNVNIKLSPYRVLIATFLWMSLILIKTIGKGMNIDYKMLVLIHKASIVLGVLVIWFIYDLKPYKGKFLMRITNFTFFIYVFHEPLLTILKKGFYYLIGISELSSFLIYIFTPIITIAISVVIGHFLKTHTNTFYKVITGNR